MIEVGDLIVLKPEWADQGMFIYLGRGGRLAYPQPLIVPMIGMLILSGALEIRRLDMAA